MVQASVNFLNFNFYYSKNLFKVIKITPFLVTSSLFLLKYPRYVQINNIYVIFKCAPILSLIFFVFQNLKTSPKSEYSKRILNGLVLSGIADALICYKK